MRAAVIDQRGGADVLRVASVPDPVAGPGQVRVRVVAAAVNPVDLKTRSGFLADIELTFPAVLGWDVSGTIEAVGEGVEGWQVGDPVIAAVAQPVRIRGTYAEQVVVNSEFLAPAPRSEVVELEHAAAIPLAGLTAWQAIEATGVDSGSLMVTGAAGSVGRFAVQLAKLRGLRIVALAGAADAEELAALGADETLDRDEPLPERIVDGVLDTAGVGDALCCVADRGSFVSIEDVPLPAPERGIEPRKSYVDEDGDRLRRLSALVDQRELRIRIADVHPLHEASTAHKRVEDGGVRGKILLRP